MYYGKFTNHKTSVNLYKTTWLHTPDDSILHSHQWEGPSLHEKGKSAFVTKK